MTTTPSPLHARLIGMAMAVAALAVLAALAGSASAYALRLAYVLAGAALGLAAAGWLAMPMGRRGRE